MKTKKTWIYLPCYFDTQSFSKVKEEISKVLLNSSFTPQFVLIDDSAGQDPQVQELISKTQVHSELITIVPPYNLGHQGAIVYALRKLGAQIEPEDFVVTMDSDGEDRPQDVYTLLEALNSQIGNLHLISIAQRTRRTETLKFRILYFCYKMFFRALTGQIIRSGNFAAFRG